MKSQTMNHSELMLLLADYRDLRGAERAAVDEHVRTCTGCAAKLAAYQVMDRDLAELPDARPDTRLRTGYYAAVGAEARPTVRSSAGGQSQIARRTLLSGLAGAVAVLVLVVGVLFVIRPGEPQPVRGAAQPTAPVEPTWEPAAMPATAAPVTPTVTVEAQRAPETTGVTLDIFSGLPNPAWRLTWEQTQELRALLDALPEAPCQPMNLNLGSRGFVVELGQRPELSNEYRLRVYAGLVRWGDPWNPEAVATCRTDTDNQIARFLLASGKPHLSEGVYVLVASEVERPAEVPADWLPYADDVFGFSLMQPPSWEQTEQTEQSRLFYRKQTRPTGPTFPVFYVTVMPEGFTNEQWEAYNFWNEAEIAAVLALEAGAAGEIHGAPGYNIYTRLPDMGVDGITGVVVESERVWEGGPDTRDRRVLVKRGTETYMLGTYYETPEELRAFEQVLASFQFEPELSATPEPAAE